MAQAEKDKMFSGDISLKNPDFGNRVWKNTFTLCPSLFYINQLRFSPLESSRLAKIWGPWLSCWNLLETQIYVHHKESINSQHHVFQMGTLMKFLPQMSP